ncbi:GNAT family N-acetyltransferase [Brachybacterium tyrofermentans]|uniref:GNAT family N-acetyltransferase n=1 Tax=Brachybacterium tyrofermentans TaxID=47848 RepID=A0ABW0FH87_9MICO
MDFIVRQQQSADTACAYLGTEPSDIRGDLEALDQHWTETVRVAVSDTGRIIGAAVIEWDEGLDRSWVHGPWVGEGEWRSVSPALLEAVTTQAPVGRHEMYASVDHGEMAWLASHCGWRSGEANFEYARTSSVPTGDIDPAIRPAVLADEAAIRELHDQEFPGTYARAAELVSPDGPYSTLVIAPEGKVLGYVAFQLQGESTLYLDFIAVHTDARRAGIGVTLIDGAQQSSGRERVVLTVDEHRPEARAFYASLGFELEAATRPYRMSPSTSSMG